MTIRLFKSFALMAAGLFLTLVPDAGHAKVPDNYDSIAVIIGNKDYTVRGTPSVKYAINDAKIMKKFLVQKLGYRPGNVKILENATYNAMRRWFGDKTEQKGILWNRVRKGRSNVFVYYSGHGAPDQRSKKPFLIPSDVDPNRARYGFELGILENNLELVKRKIGLGRQVVLMLDACFSGKTAGGEPLLAQSRGAYKPQMPARLTKKGVIRIAASGPLQVANWDHRLKHGLFTGRFIKAVEGEADKGRFGNSDGIVSWKEIKAQLEDEVPYLARSRGGSEQEPEFPQNAKVGWQIKSGAIRVEQPAGKTIDPTCDRQEYEELKDLESIEDWDDFLTRCKKGRMARLARGYRNKLKRHKEMLARRDQERTIREKEREVQRESLLKRERELQEKLLALQKEREASRQRNQQSRVQTYRPSPPPAQETAPQIPQPSWCSSARLKPDEETICNNATLIALDYRMSSLYLTKRRSRRVRKNQSRWLKGRGACGYDASCLEMSMRNQISYLENQ